MPFVGERCATCGFPLVERTPESPAVRYCEQHYWDEQTRRLFADEDVDRLAMPAVVRRVRD